MPSSPYYGTENVGDDAAHKLDQRLGRCYELAGYALTLGDAPAGSTLVHGSIHAVLLRNTTRIDHAWIELPDGDVWEPVSRVIWPIGAWNAFAQPVISHRYVADEARTKILNFHHWGPWESDDTESEDK